MAYNHSEIENFQHENKLTRFIDEATCCASHTKANLGNGLVKIAYTESCALLQECCLSKSDHSSCHLWYQLAAVHVRICLLRTDCPTQSRVRLFILINNTQNFRCAMHVAFVRHE